MTILIQVLLLLGGIGFCIGSFLLTLLGIISFFIVKNDSLSQSFHLPHSYIKSFLIIALIIFTSISVFAILLLVIQTNIPFSR